MKKCLGIVFPAARPDWELVRCAEKLLVERGYRVKIGEWGDAQERAENFTEMWCDPEVDLVWAGRGGYGTMPMLPYLDFRKIGKTKKRFVGMSDITALHLALHREIEIATFLGPMVETFVKSEFSQNHFLEAFENEIECGDDVITGGNLALISAMIGSRWEIETAGKILLLEDVNEEAYRIDRMLCQLAFAGKLDNLKALILASFSGCSGDLESVFDRYFKDAPYPIVRNFPSGHIDDQYTIPLNCPVQTPITVPG